MKQELYKQVRTRYNLAKTTTERNFFTREEMMEIVSKVYGKNKPWTQGITYMGDCLSSYGWSKQATTDTHPSRENLQWLLSVPFETAKTQKTSTLPNKAITMNEVVKGMNPSLMRKMKGISIDKTGTTITMKF